VLLWKDVGEVTEEGEYSLVMPFVACVSKGGPYDDDAFVAGYQAALLSGQLKMGSAIGAKHFETVAYSGLSEQLDLIAMQWGYSVEAIPEGEWTTYRFTLIQ